MLRFFRPIRQALLNEGKTVKYLKYALGEITLVVIGILIALQLNLWKEDRARKQEERQNLEQIREEFRANLTQLDEKISMRKAMIRSAFNLLAYYDDHTLIDPDSVNTFLARTTVSPTFDPVTNDIIISGKLQQISDIRLRKKLSSWSSDLIQVTEEETAWLGFNRNVFSPYLREHYPTRNIQHQKWNGLDVAQILLLDKSAENNVYIGPSKLEIDLEVFFSDHILESLLSSVISTNMFANTQSYALRKDLLEILQYLDENLDTSD